MHPSTIAAILAFTAGMTVNAVPVVRPEGTPEPPADRLRTTVGHTQARPQLSELAQDEFTVPSIGKRDHPIRPLPACSGSSEPSIGIPCISSDLDELVNRPSNGIRRPGVLNTQAIKRDPQRLLGDDDSYTDLGILVPPTLEEMLERKKQAGFSKEKRDPQRGRNRGGNSPDDRMTTIGLIPDGPAYEDFPGDLEVIEDFPKEKRQSGQTFRGGVLPFNDQVSAGILNPPTLEELLERKKQTGFRKAKRQSRDSVRLVGLPVESSVTPEELEEIVNNDKQFRKEFGGIGAKKKREAQIIDAGFGFDAGVTIDPSALTGGLKQLIPGQKVKRDPQVIDAGFGFDAGVTIDPSTITDKLTQFIPAQKEKREAQRVRLGVPGPRLAVENLFYHEGKAPNLLHEYPANLGKRDDMGADFGFSATPEPLVLPVRRPSQKVTRDAQIDAGVGFDAGITIDPVALPGHIKKLLPIQRTKRDPQNRGKGHVFGKIAEGVAGGIGAVADGLTIHQALQGKPA